MKKIILAFALGLAAASASAQITIGPLTQTTMCPSPARSTTSGKNKFCIFDDPKVVQVLQTRCPSAPAGTIAVQSTAGRDTWCVIRR